MQVIFIICPYIGDPPDDQTSDYVISVGGINFDAWRPNSCWARYINDALDAELDNVVAILVDRVIWIAPLPGVEILAHQELYIAYDWEYWYRKWRTCAPQLRLRIENRYPIADSIPQSRPTSPNEIEEHWRVADVWYKHWA